MNNTKIAAFLFSLAFGIPSWAGLFGPSCDQAENAVKPSWAQLGYSYERPGFKHGFSQAKYRRKEPYQEQLARAINMARSELARSLQVVVESSIDIQSELQTSGTKPKLNEVMTQRTKTASKLELPNVKVKEKWQDPKSCNLYVLVEISSAEANLVSKKAVVNSFYTQAQDNRFSIQLRMTAINNAIDIARRWEFSDLTNSESSAEMINKFQAVKLSLERLRSSKNNIIMFVGDSLQLPVIGEISQKISSQIQGSFKGTKCSTLTMCLATAQKSPAAFATIVSPRMSVVKDRGFYMGSFNLMVTIWDLSTNRQIYSTTDKNILKTAKVMDRQRHKVSTSAGYEKWLLTNPGTLDDLGQHYQ